MKDFIDFEKLERLSATDSSVPLYQKVIKLSEEAGEVSQAFLAYDGSKNTSASAGNSAEDVIEEVCDVLNVAIDILNYLAKDEETEQLVKEMFQRKLDKWESKTKGYAVYTSVGTITVSSDVYDEMFGDQMYGHPDLRKIKG